MILILLNAERYTFIPVVYITYPILSAAMLAFHTMVYGITKQHKEIVQV